MDKRGRYTSYIGILLFPFLAGCTPRKTAGPRPGVTRTDYGPILNLDGLEKMFSGIRIEAIEAGIEAKIEAKTLDYISLRQQLDNCKDENEKGKLAKRTAELEKEYLLLPKKYEQFTDYTDMKKGLEEGRLKGSRIEEEIKKAEKEHPGWIKLYQEKYQKK